MSRSNVQSTVERLGQPLVPSVVREVSAELNRQVDWTSWYLSDEEDMGESPEQAEIIRLLIAVLEQLALERSWTDIYIGHDAFFAWMPAEPLVRVSPDVYLLRDPPAPPLPPSWQTWRTGHQAPLLAFEVVSEDWRKDYDLAPQKYAHLGVQELVIFDPRAARDPSLPDRTALQVFRRMDDGLFTLGQTGSGPIRCRTLDVYAVVCPTPRGPRLRLARDGNGDVLVPTVAEAERAAREEAEQACKKAERACKMAERQQNLERKAREKAERELAELRAQLIAIGRDEK